MIDEGTKEYMEDFYESLNREIKGTVDKMVERGIVPPLRPIKEWERYRKLPEEIATIDGATLANYLSAWTAFTNWAGYSLAGSKIHYERNKRMYDLEMKIAIETENGSYKTLAEKRGHLEIKSSFRLLEAKVEEWRTHVSLLEAIYESNQRILQLFSREISRRSVSYREDFSNPNARSS